MRDPPPWPRAARGRRAPVDPVERHPGSRGGLAIHCRVVTHVHRVSRSHSELVQSDVEDSRVGLGESATLGRDDALEERSEPRRPEAGPLHAVDAVRDHSQAEALRKARENGPAAGQAVAARGQVIQEVLAEPRRPPRIALQVDQELAEALAREVGLPDLAPPVQVPEGIVDLPVGDESRARTGEPEIGESGAKGRPLGPVEVEQGVVDVEENGAESGQAGIGEEAVYLAR